MGVTIDELTVADRPEAWRALGFAVDGDICTIGEVGVRLIGTEAGRGLVGWSLRGVGATELEGLATTRAERTDTAPDPPAHPNGVTGVDHVVAFTPALDRTVATLEAAGLDLRRIREQPTPAGAPRQAFFRLGPTILEVVQQPAEAIPPGGEEGPAFFWGLALLAPDLDATLAALGDRAGQARAAVQPGRRIATLPRSAGLALPVALITPPPRSS
jgi:hypothetical protein